MSRLLKVSSTVGGVGTIAGITGIAILASQAPETTIPTLTKGEGAKVVYLHSPIKQRSTGTGFGLDFDIEDVKKYRERKIFREYIKDKEENKDLKTEKKKLKEEKGTLDAQKKELQTRVEQLKTQIAEKEKKLAAK